MLERMKGLAGDFAKQEEIEENDLAELRKAIVVRESFLVLINIPGWIEFNDILQLRFESLARQLRQAIDMTIVTRLQAQLNEMEYVMQLVPTAIAAGQAAKNKIAERKIT